VRHINRIVTVTRVQPIVRVHMVTRVHHIVLTRVHTQVIPRVHVAVIPRVHTRTAVLNQNQYVAETRILPTRYAMAGSRTVSVGTRMAGLYDMPARRREASNTTELNITPRAGHRTRPLVLLARLSQRPMLGLGQCDCWAFGAPFVGRIKF
jgi:hypothetical protein